jgi:hypothetical protein
VPAGAKKEKEDEDIPFCYRNNRCMFMAVSSGGTSAIFSHKNKSSIGGREKIAQHLSKALEDQGALLFYRKLVGSRRLDLLKNCLEITLEADKAGIIKTTKGRYFTGVLKVKTATQERLKKYKNCHGLIKGEFNGVGVTGGLAKEEVIELFGPEVIRREH